MEKLARKNEIAEGDGEEGNTNGWDELQQMPAMPETLEEIEVPEGMDEFSMPKTPVVDDRTEEERMLGESWRATNWQEQIRAWEERDKRMRAETLEHVDTAEAEKYISEFSEKLDEQKLVEIRDKMRENYEDGAQAMADYMAEALGLDHEQVVFYRDNMDMRAWGQCVRGEKQDIIKVNANIANFYNIPDQIETLAHECWHSYQFMLAGMNDGKIHAGRTADVGGESVEGRVMEEKHKDRGELYKYNFDNYKDMSEDFEGYVKQLVEVEARLFGTEVRKKLNKYEQSQESLREQTLTKVNTREMYKVIRERMRQFSADEFLRVTGKKSLKELGKADFEEVLPEVMNYLNGMLGVAEPWAVEVVDLDDGVLVAADAERKTFSYNKKAMDRNDTLMNIRNVANAAWQIYQMDMVKHGKYDPRGELYAFNTANMINYKDDPEGYWKQLVVQERWGFADSLYKEILKEKTMEPYKMARKKVKGWLGRLGRKKNGDE